MINRIIVASKNEGKIAEYRELFRPIGIEIASYEGGDIPEIGSTFEENSRIKAETACKETGLPAIGDDSGICLRSLDGFPGLRSQRFAEESGGYPRAFEKIESMLRGKGGDRDAYFICAIALAAPGQKTRTFEGRVNGFATYPPRGTNGFGYDPIFVANGMGRTFAEISREEKIAIDHRGAAFAKLRAWLESLSMEEKKKAAKGPGFVSDDGNPAVNSKPAAPKGRPAKKVEGTPVGEWGEAVQGVEKLRPRGRGMGAKAKAESAAKAVAVEKAEEFEMKVEYAEIQKENG
jgi:XTP/dITP diphosphohydrolase